MSASPNIQCQSDSQQATLTEKDFKNTGELNGLTDDDGEFTLHSATAITAIKAELRSITCLMDDLLRCQTELNSLLFRLENSNSHEEKTALCTPFLLTTRGQVTKKRKMFLPFFDPPAKDAGALQLLNWFAPLAGHDFEESLEMVVTSTSEEE